jgi:hypothetical protein
LDSAGSSKEAEFVRLRMAVARPRTVCGVFRCGGARISSRSLTRFYGLRILIPCEFAQPGAAVVVSARRVWVTESFRTHSARCGVVLYLDFAQSHPKTPVALVPQIRPPGKDFIRRKNEHSNRTSAGHIRHSAH